jgi:hypothetical protein
MGPGSASSRSRSIWRVAPLTKKTPFVLVGSTAATFAACVQIRLTQDKRDPRQRRLVSSLSHTPAESGGGRRRSRARATNPA